VTRPIIELTESDEEGDSPKLSDLNDGKAISDVDKTEDEEDEEDDSFRSAKDLLPTLLKLLMNPLFVAETLAASAGVYYIAGWIGYLPKYFEVQFFLTASQANIFAGKKLPLGDSLWILDSG